MKKREEKATSNKGQAQAARFAKQLIEAPETVRADQISSSETMMYLMGEYTKPVWDAVAKVLGRANLGDDEYWQVLQAMDREIGLHSNIPECCVDFYVNSHETIKKRYPWLGQRAQDNMAMGIRMYGRRNHGDIPPDNKPMYHSCPECTRRLVLGEIKPNELHICKDRRESKLCAQWIDVRKQRGVETAQTKTSKPSRKR